MIIGQHRQLFRLRSPRGLRFVYVHGKGLALFTRRPFRKGEKVIALEGECVSARTATPEAVQVDERRFLDTRYLVPGDFINHSCRPNLRLDIPGRRFAALRDIPADTEITYNYLTSEWDMRAFGTDFTCRCGARGCVGRVRGFRYLGRPQREKLRPLLSPFLLSQMAE